MTSKVEGLDLVRKSGSRPPKRRQDAPNSDFKAIGVTSAAFTDIESIAMGPGHKELETFIEIIMMNE